MDKISGIKVIEISTGKEVDYIFTDMGDVKSYPDGEFFTSKLEVNGKEYFSRTSKALFNHSPNPLAFRLTQDFPNFEKQGFKLII